MTDPRPPQQPGAEPERLVSQERADGVIEVVEGLTAKRALALIEDPERVNLEKAIDLVNKRFGGRLKVNLNDIIFKRLAGNRIGEASAEGTVIDPIMLLHPAVRLAHVIAHELAHQKGEVDPEGMVESYVALFFPEGDLEHSYDQAQIDFQKLAERMKVNESKDGMIEQIYEWYAEERYEEIYQRYADTYMSGLESDAKKEEAFSFFLNVFPELESNGDGWMDVQEVAQDEVFEDLVD